LEGALPLQQIAQQWQLLKDKSLALAQRLEQVNPTLIDYFLAQNSDLQEIGKLVIAMVILRREHGFNITNENQNKRSLGGTGPSAPIIKSSDDWLRFVLYKITAYCDRSKDLLQNDVSFVTFNYDTSVERRLRRGLQSISRFEPADIEMFLAPPRITHVYGQICEPHGEPIKIKFPLPTTLSRHANVDEKTGGQETINNCFAASHGIFTIDGEEKEQSTEALEHARCVISEAEIIFVLGYGFDDSNNRRLKLKEAFARYDHPRSIMFTNMGGIARVSKAASRVMFNHPAVFMNSQIQQQAPMVGGVQIPLNWEMSKGNCYSALADDFESLEE